MLLPEALNETQLITLRDVLRTAGLKERHIEDVMLLLWTKPHRIQLAFCFRAIGMPYASIAWKMDKPIMTVHGWVANSCADIKKYFTAISVKMP